MRRVLLALVGTVTGVVLLLNFKVRAIEPGSGVVDVLAAGRRPAATAEKTPRAATPKATRRSSAPKATSPATKAPAKDEPPAEVTILGDAVDSQFGPVQVKVTTAGSRIVAVDAVQVPSENPTSVQKSSSAVPQLTSRVLAAQNADVDTVSGATYTSEGYLRSLQSALDKA